MKLGRKISGGRYKAHKKKKSYESAGQKRIVKLGETKLKTQSTRGGGEKVVMLKGKIVNLSPKKKGEKAKKVEITNVIETPSNRFLARQNIITKGTIVQTSEGKVKITNKPSQQGTINGILIE